MREEDLLLENETNKIIKTLEETRDIHIKQCCIDLIKEHLREDVTDWDKSRIDSMLELKGYSLVITQNPLGSLYLGLYNNASKTINDGYEIYLDTQQVQDENGEEKFTITVLSKKLNNKKKDSLSNGKKTFKMLWRSLYKRK